MAVDVDMLYVTGQIKSEVISAPLYIPKPMWGAADRRGQG